MDKYFESKGMNINGILNLSPKEASKEFKNGAYLLDLRRENEIRYKSFPVENSILSQPEEVKTHYENLPKDKPLIVADNSGLRSKEITVFLVNAGFQNTANLIGGMFEWDRDGLPVNINNMERLNGSCLCQTRKPRVERKKK